MSNLDIIKYWFKDVSDADRDVGNIKSTGKSCKSQCETESVYSVPSRKEASRSKQGSCSPAESKDILKFLRYLRAYNTCDVGNALIDEEFPGLMDVKE